MAGRAWQGGMHDRGVCMAGACVVGGVRGWEGGCTGGCTAADRTHPTGMHSC